MKRLLLTATILAAPSLAHAGAAVVTDPGNTMVSQFNLLESLKQTAHQIRSLTNEAKMLFNQELQLLNDARKIAELYRSAEALIHGNIYAASGFLGALQDLGLVDPNDMTGAAFGDLMSGLQDLASTGTNAYAQLSNDARALRRNQQFYVPAGSYFAAVHANAGAAASSMQQAAATRMFDTARQRALHLRTLSAGIGQSRDVTDAANAGARVGLETATNTAQTNMLLATQMQQSAQAGMRETQRAAAWHASVDQHRADSEAALAVARSGVVQWQTGTGIRRIAYSATATDTMGAMPVTTPGLSPSGTTYQGGTTQEVSLLQSRDWGTDAIAAAESRGINRAAFAGFCNVESNCTDVARGGNGSIEGPWQMTGDTFRAAAGRAGIPQAQWDNGNPRIQALAAAEEMRTIGTTLQNAGVEATGINVRAGYQWGQGYAVSLARAPDEAPMSSVLRSYSPAVLDRNGVSNKTVGQWRAEQARKLGSSATQSIFITTGT